MRRPPRAGSRSLGRPGALLAAALAIAGASRPSRADPGAPGGQALAEALFQQAKKLMAEGSYAEACPKLAESHRLDPGGGTVLTLAICHEREGKTASAWAEYNEALAMALKDEQVGRQAVAKARLAALEGRLSRLTVRVAPGAASAPGLQILRDGVELGRPAWGVPAPVDPGEHRIEARAPGRRSQVATITLRDGDARSVDVGELVDAPASAPAPAPAGPRGGAPAWGQRTAGLLAGGVGVAGLGVGAYFALHAFSQHGIAVTRCPASPCGDRTGVDANDDARRSANAATILLAAGAATVALGTFLVLSAPARPRTPTGGAVRSAPFISVGPGRLALEGVF